MFAGVLATLLLLIFLISFEELDRLVFRRLWDIESRIYFFPGLERFCRKEIAQNKAAAKTIISQI